MANNVILNGYTFQTDEISGVHSQVVKLAYGAEDSVSYMDVKPATESSLSAMNAKVPALGSAAITSAVPVVLANDLTVGAAASTAALNIDLLTGNSNGWFDAAAFQSCSINIIGGSGISAGAIWFEETNDITNASAGTPWQIEEPTSLTPTPQIIAITIAASTLRMFKAPVAARYVRVRVSTAFVGGTVQAVAVFSQMPYNRMVQTVHQATAANFNATIAAIPAGTNAVGDVGIQYRANATGAASVAKIVAAASTNATSVKGSTARVVGWSLFNNTAAVKFVRLYNKTTAPTVGTDSPALVIPIPANGQITYYSSGGIAFGSGLAYAITNAVADLDATAVAANDVLGGIYYA